MSFLDELCSLKEEYLSATKEQQKFLEQRYGKHVIQRLLEESYSREWLKDNSKKCPYCGTHIQVNQHSEAHSKINLCKSWFFHHRRN